MTGALLTSAQYRAMAKPRRSKYGNRKIVVDGHTFDSKAEARRYVELSRMMARGEIAYLARQHSYVLAKGVHIAGEKRARPDLRCVVDFVYHDNATKTLIVEDVKGIDTPASRIKRHLMKTVHGIDVRVVK